MTDINTLKPYMQGAPRELIQRVLTSDDSTDFRNTPLSVTYSARVATTEDITTNGAQTVDGVLIDVAPGATLYTQMQNLVLKLSGSSPGLYLPVNNGAWTNLSAVLAGRLTYVRTGTHAGKAYYMNTPAPYTFTEFNYHRAFHGSFLPQPIASTNLPTFSGNTGHFVRYSDYRFDFNIRISVTFTSNVASAIKFWVPFTRPITTATEVFGQASAVTTNAEMHSFNITGDSTDNAINVAFTKATGTTARILQISGSVQITPPEV